MRGGDPLLTINNNQITIIFPACAGVILKFDLNFMNEKTFPRMRGGDPKWQLFATLTISFSPHARG